MSEIKLCDKTQSYIQLLDRYVAVSKTDVNGVITCVSEAFCKITGYEKEELLGSTHALLRHEEVGHSFYNRLRQTIASGEIWRGEILNRRKDGQEFWTYAIITPEVDEEGKVNGYICIRHDCTDKKRLEELSLTDDLTGLYNRRHFNFEFESRLSRAKRTGVGFTVCLLDVDNFKKYNDTYGHDRGDEALKLISHTLRHRLKRATDAVFRIGGEEFAFLVETKAKRCGNETAVMVKEAVEQLKIEHANNSPFGYITASIGTVSVNFKNDKQHGIGTSDIFRLADEALYKAKAAGRNRVETAVVHKLKAEG